MNQQQQQRQKEKQLQELTVAKAELTGGDTSGLVYVRSSPGAAFLIKPRVEALKDVQQKIDELKQSRWFYIPYVQHINVVLGETYKY